MSSAARRRGSPASFAGACGSAPSPTALPALAEITSPLLASHLSISLEIRSPSCDQIVAELASYRIDAGISYLENELVPPLANTPVYTRALRLPHSASPAREDDGVSGLNGVPLCLLSRDMQNRRIVDAAMREGGAEPATRIETNSISVLLSYTRAEWPCVVSDAWLSLDAVPREIAALPLAAPEASHVVGVVTRQTELTPALLEGLATPGSRRPPRSASPELPRRTRAA